MESGGWHRDGESVELNGMKPSADTRHEKETCYIFTVTRCHFHFTNELGHCSHLRIPTVSVVVPKGVNYSSYDSFLPPQPKSFLLNREWRRATRIFFGATGPTS